MGKDEALLGPGGRQPPSVGEILKQFVTLGFTAFGGPPVHLGMFQKQLVDEKGWMSSERYTELIAMANCLPGPSSTQVAFAIGITQQGVLGGLASGFGFLLPGAFIMTGVGFAATLLRDQVEDPTSVANSIAIACSAVGVALVFIAVTQLVKKNAAGPRTGAICFGAAGLCLMLSPPPAWLNPALILLGGLLTVISPDPDAVQAQLQAPSGKTGLPTWAALAIFALYFVVAAFTIYDQATDHGWLIPFLTAGMFVWGGGPVVLPMLMTALTPRWVPHTIFLTGIALAEMSPGPVFNMSCFLGVQLALQNGFSWPLGTFLAWAGLVGPGVTLIFGAVPIWSRFRDFEVYKHALPGLNAAAVGLLVSTVFFVYQALDSRSPWPGGSRAVALASYAAIDLAKVSVPTVVLVAGLAGVVYHFAQQIV